jgi:hypothetical protein
MEQSLKAKLVDMADHYKAQGIVGRLECLVAKREATIEEEEAKLIEQRSGIVMNRLDRLVIHPYIAKMNELRKFE